MPQTRPNGTIVPINSDEYNLTADLADMADSIHVVTPVADKTARDLLTPYVGLQVCRMDRDGWIQTYTGTTTASGWEYLGRRKRYAAVDGDWTNLSGAASRLVCSVSVPIKDYPRRMSLFARSTIYCPAISSGAQEINLNVSLMQSAASASQGRSRISWTPGFSNINQSVATNAEDILVGANSTPLARVWVEVVSGGLTTTANTGTYSEFHIDVRPEDD